MIRQYELVERVKAYDPDADEDALNRAYVYAMKMHGSQVRASGDPYFSHPLEVAGILTNLKLDTASIVTALLHDVVEDTPAKAEDVKKMFGAEIAQLVDGVTKLAKIRIKPSEDGKAPSISEVQAENFRKLLLAMSQDIRVLLVKLADRLHNMRTIRFIPPEKQRRIAAETLDLYVPLAERIGVHQIKDELEDLCFACLNPEARDSIVTRLKFLRSEGGDTAKRIIAELDKRLRASGLNPEITGREKSPYSIWRKMQKKNVAFEQLSDIMAFRVVMDNVGECYQALGEIHSHYPLVPGRFKDYISTPKPNGYKSLHTTVIGPERQRIEIQIRTADMHETADLGVAAHWAYKQGQKTDTSQYRWLRELLEILDHAQKPEEFLEHTKLELFQDQVFCFTPKGDLIALPQKATPVDFAYAIHSAIGDHCVGAKVNGRIVPLTSELHNGDQVDISTSKTQTPSPAWERFVATGKARAHIRRFVRNQQRQEYLTLGKAMLQKIFKQEGYEFTDKAVAGVVKQFRADNAEDIYADVGAGLQSAKEVFNAIFPGHKPAATVPTEESINSQGRAKAAAAAAAKPKGKNAPLPIKGLIPGMAIHYAGCCHPLPGDRIVGIVTTGKGVTIHTIDCESLESFNNRPERWLDVSWNDAEDTPEGLENHVGRLHIAAGNESGNLGTITTIIGRNSGNITNLLVTNRTSDYWEMLVDVEVKDVKQLTNIIAALRATPAINQVDRARSG
jgi:GTP pyrophosphokinase